MTYIGSGIVTQQFLNDTIPALSGVTQYNLSIAPANVNAIIVWANSGATSIFYPPSSYTLNGAIINFNGTVTAPLPGYTINVRFLGVPAIPFSAPNSSIGINQLSATGNASTQTFLRGDNSWAATPTVFNRITNGDMRIDQRNNGASRTPTVSGTYTLDRWVAYIGQASKFTVQRNAGSITPPAGFTNYLGVSSLSAYTPLAADEFNINQPIEGFNIADFGFGSAQASTITLSFWVRSSLSGSFGGCVRNGAINRSYPFLYTIAAANTWTKIAITIPGDTTGTWATDNTNGMFLTFALGNGTNTLGVAGAWAAGNFTGAVGQVNIVATNAATWQVTGVQIELGSAATQFQYRPIGQELSLCERYYEKSYDPSVTPGTASSTFGFSYQYVARVIPVNYGIYFTKYRTVKRATTSVTVYSLSGTAGSVSEADSGATLGAVTVVYNGSTGFLITNAAGASIGPAAIGWHFTADAEL